jgi:uncharacterized protein (DUF1501 family)
MDRRKFFKIAAMTGLAVSAPLGIRRVLAKPEPYKGPFFVLVNASGGWDPVYLCDPKPSGELNRLYGAPPARARSSTPRPRSTTPPSASPPGPPPTT